jgi:REP element-mobilizing transposase RayT
MGMARTARKKSESGIYHIMLRGINRQAVFLDEEDSRHFLDVLQLCKGISEYRVYAYCLMGNHVHLLLQTGKEPLELAMKRICTRFVVWYNAKYDRIGHLFQDRYKSEPVDDDTYFITVLRYILRNPVKAGICENPEAYELSSAKDYYDGGGMTDTAFAEEIIGQDELLRFLSEPNEDVCMDDEPSRLTDKTAGKQLCELVGASELKAAAAIVSASPGKYIPELKHTGLSIRQICRLTGIPFGIVRKL